MSGQNEKFRKNFALLLKQSGDRVEEVARITFRRMGASLVERSPVGDPSGWASPAPAGYVGGRFKNNWNCSTQAVDFSTEGGPDGVGASSMGRIQRGLDGWKAGQKVFITNSLPYSRRLEYGWSDQAPGGMVRLTVADFAASIRRAVQETRK